MGTGTYAIYNVGFNVEYKPKWTSSTLSITSTDFTQKLYWVNSNEDIKCDVTGGFVEPETADRYMQGKTHATKTKLLLYSRSICHYPITVTETSWSYYYPLVAKSIESIRAESYGKVGAVYKRASKTELGKYPSNGAQKEYSGTTYWYELETVHMCNEIYFKNELNIWVKAQNTDMFVCTDFGWRPIERIEVYRQGYNIEPNYWTY